MVRIYGEQYATAESMPVEEAGWMYLLRSTFVATSKSKTLNCPSSKPTTARQTPSRDSFVSTAREVGAEFPSTSKEEVANNVLSFLTDQALSPAVESAVYTMPSCSLTKIG